MAKIIINDVDNTTAGGVIIEDQVVYIPGFSSLSDDEGFSNAPTLCKTVNEFQLKFGSEPVSLSGSPDKSYIMAYELLSAGLYVLYEVPASVSTASDMTTWIGTPSNLTKLKDQGLYNIRFLTAGGYGDLTNESAGVVGASLIAVAAARKDCTALVDTTEAVTSVTNIKTAYNLITTNGKYASGFVPWGSVVPGITSVTTAQMLPGSFAYLNAFATSIQTNPIYFAVAGPTRGLVPTGWTPKVVLGEADADALQERTGVAVNPICQVNPYGYRIWGNRTLFNNVTNLTASSFLNIRNLVSDIVKTTYLAAKSQTFEQNTDVLWVNFKALITPLLDQMQSGNGIEGYKIVKVTTNEKAKLAAKIEIVPIEPVEDFEITIVQEDELTITA